MEKHIRPDTAPVPCGRFRVLVCTCAVTAQKSRPALSRPKAITAATPHSYSNQDQKVMRTAGYISRQRMGENT